MRTVSEQGWKAQYAEGVEHGKKLERRALKRWVKDCIVLTYEPEEKILQWLATRQKRRKG